MTLLRYIVVLATVVAMATYLPSDSNEIIHRSLSTYKDSNQRQDPRTIQRKTSQMQQQTTTNPNTGQSMQASMTSGNQIMTNNQMQSRATQQTNNLRPMQTNVQGLTQTGNALPTKSGDQIMTNNQMQPRATQQTNNLRPTETNVQGLTQTGNALPTNAGNQIMTNNQMQPRATQQTNNLRQMDSNVQGTRQSDNTMSMIVDNQTPNALPQMDRPSDSDMAQLVEQFPLAELNHFRDSSIPYSETDIPIYFHIPKAGGSTVKDVVGSCLRMVMASEFGVSDGHDTDTEIAIVYPKVPGGTGSEDRSPFVNVDATTIAGIDRAANMGFADSGLAGCVVTPFLYESNALFTETAQGRLFAVFRHPVDRAVSMFYYIQVADWEPSYMPELQKWNLHKYATSAVIENNWMTRQLANQMSGELDDSHIKIAMEVVRRKFVVGLMTKLEESMTRFEKFFRWKYHVNPENQEKCRERLTSGGSNSNKKNKKKKPKPGEPVWDLIAAQNLYDIQLYEYIQTLFVEQESLVADMPDDFRNIDATCCKCTPPTFPPEGFACPTKVVNAA